jgi:transposase
MQEEKRNKVYNLYECGITDRSEIVKRTNIPYSTVCQIIARKNEGKPVEHMAGAGRPFKFNSSDKKRVSNLAIAHLKWSVAKIGNLAEKRGTPAVSDRMIRRYLNRSGYLKLMPKPVPMMTAKHIENRLNWCQRHQDFDWERVVFTDESYFEYNRNKIPLWSREKPQIMTPKRSPAIMIWGGISLRGTTPLSIGTGHINSSKYIDILNENLIPAMEVLYPEGYILQQENARAHISNETKKWMTDAGINIMDWPAASPDLSIIENVWGLMKNRIENLDPRSVPLWKQEIQNVWDDIDQDFLGNYFESIPKRIKLCIEANGGPIDY